jgi:hypothetical protein
MIITIVFNFQKMECAYLIEVYLSFINYLVNKNSSLNSIYSLLITLSLYIMKLIKIRTTKKVSATFVI